MKHADQSGQALISLLAFMAVAITLTGAAVIVTILNLQGTTTFNHGQEALSYAETGAENAVINLLRDNTYLGETLAVGDGTAIITVTGVTTKTIVSSSQKGEFTRTIQVSLIEEPDGTLSVTEWSEPQP